MSSAILTQNDHRQHILLKMIFDSVDMTKENYEILFVSDFLFRVKRFRGCDERQSPPMTKMLEYINRKRWNGGKEDTN